MNKLVNVELDNFKIYPTVQIPALFEDEEIVDILKNNDTVVFSKHDSDYAVEVKVVQWMKVKDGYYKFELHGLSPVKITKREDGEVEFDYIEVSLVSNSESLKKIDDLTDSICGIYSGSLFGEGVSHASFADMDEYEIIYYSAQCLELDNELHDQVLSSVDGLGIINILNTRASVHSISEKLDYELTNNIRNNVEEQQREYILREKMKEIEKELGEGDEDDTKKFDEQLEKCLAPDDIKLKIKRELKRFKKLPQMSGEKGPLENYIRTMLELPWGVYTTDDNSLEKAKQILDRDHYGMTDVKDRILEYLAVRSLSEEGDGKGTVLCLSGAPGLGKTSIAQSLAEALGRNFQKVSLGGVTDESAIRGHRRTYVGSMSGKIIQAINKSGTSNPVILLDEIDKLGSSEFRGDPTAAMLEVLDPSQNHKFEDHYLDCEYDLSKVIFIATANYLEKIPHALRDRLEIVGLSGYTVNEKVKIAKKHLLPKAMKDNNVKDSNINIDLDTLEHVVKGYTKEAGVRNLQRAMNTICRKAATKSVIDGLDIQNFTITKEFVKEALGIVKFDGEEIEKESQVGLVNGMYYSASGGGILPLSVITLQGKGKLNVTGSVKDDMKESTQIALAYVRSVANKYGVSNDFFNEVDFHLHTGDISTPKSGPSASLAMMTALLSAASKRKVKQTFAMTGESNLFGKAMPIGGVKEKILGAKSAGCTDIIIPKSNEKDLEDVPEEVLEGLTIHSVTNVEEVFNLVLE